MIERLYIDNFRCMVKCEIKLQRVGLLLGPNGSGKSTALDVTQALRRFTRGTGTAYEIFPPSQLTKWQSLDHQIFELDLRTDQGLYRYALIIEHAKDRSRARVKSETLALDGQPLLAFNDGKVQLYNDRHEAWPLLFFDFAQSALSFINPGEDHTKLSAFKRCLEAIVFLRPCPPIMNADSPEEDDVLEVTGANFPSWFRYLTRQDISRQLDLLQELRLALEGFESLRLDGPADATATMKVLFKGNGMPPVSYKLNELSDGQRQLILLYTVLWGVADPNRILFLDEPDNYLSLQEIQPWLTALMDQTGRSLSQAILISHHSGVIDHLASEKGVWLTRDANGATRVSYDRAVDTAPLRPSEVEARGWTHG